MERGERYHDLIGTGRALNYATRCRLVVDEVVRRYGGLVDPADRAAPAFSWLEDELDAAASTPGTMARLLRPASLMETPAGASMADLRSWTWRRLGSPGDSSWSRGAESRSMWSFLMSPTPADDDERWWLASSNGLSAERLGALIDAAEAPPPPARRSRTPRRSPG